MNPLAPSDQFYLTASIGWLELGNFEEAKRELCKVNASSKDHPEVLEVRCRVHEAEGEWRDVLAIATELSRQFPKRMDPWLHQARSLYHLGNLPEAYHLLVDVVELFPDNPMIRYEIACYAAQRGLCEEALEWLKIVFKINGGGIFRRKAPDEPMLRPIRKEILELWS